MSLEFKTIPKKPKDKIQVIRRGQIIGYIDFDIKDQLYKVKFEFEIQLSYIQVYELGKKMLELK